MGSKKVKTSSTSTPIIPENAKGQIDNYYSGLGNTFQNGSPQDFVVAPTAQQQAAFGNVLTGQNAAIDQAISKASSIPKSGYALAPVATANATTAQTVQGRAQTAQAPDRGILGGLTLGDPTKVDLSGLSGVQAQQAQSGSQAVGGAAEAGIAADYLDRYKPTADAALVKATMATFNDQAGREKAAYAAQAAGRGAFGGSRQAIGEAQLGADIARQGALTRAQMQDQAYTRALEAASGDAGRVTQAGIAGAANATQASIANANNSNQLNMFNAGQQNDILKLLTQGNIQAELANAGYANQFDLARFGAENDNNRLIYGTEADLGMFNAGQANNMTQFNTGQQNAGNQFNAGLQTQTSQFNAGQTNDNNQFNAQTRTQADQFNRNLALQQAQLLGSLGNAQADNMRADMTLNANLGQMDRNMQLQNQLAPYAYQQMYGELLNPALISAISGQQTEGTQKQSGGLLQSLLAAGAQVGSAALMSERRVKRDIVKLDEEADGLGRYQFRYLWDDDNDPVRFGTMVDEVERLRPWALGPVVDGVKTVDYSKLEAR